MRPRIVKLGTIDCGLVETTPVVFKDRLYRFDGHVAINYSWGNQEGIEFLAEARFDGSLAAFLTGWYPG